MELAFRLYMPTLTLLFTALVSFSLSAWLAQRFCDPSSWFYILDNPNERSLHTIPTPRSGGAAILVGLLTGAGLIAFIDQATPHIWVLISLVPVAVVSYLDDRAAVPVLLRLVSHIVGAGLLIWGGDLTFQNVFLLDINVLWLPWISILFVLTYIVWMINLYNFMDGIDGLAAGMAVIGFGFLAIIGCLTENFQFAQISLVVAAAGAGFLFFNFPPARIFMGDSGSSTLGMLVAALSLWGARDGVFPLWIAILIFSPFIADASVTLIRRMFHGETVWKPHKTHYYQKLMQAGWGHRKTVLAEYAIMSGCGISALLCVRGTVTVQLAVITGWVIFYIILFSWISWYASKRLGDAV